MANAIVHSESSVKRFGGKLEDYLIIHEKMDCHKAYVADNRARVLTHTMFWIKEVMVPIFGSYITLEDGKKVSVKDICEQHILEDYKMKFIPTPQDFIQEMEFKKWMQNGSDVCPSAQKLYKPLEEKIQPEEEKIVVNTPEIISPIMEESNGVFPSENDMIMDGTQEHYNRRILD